MPNAPTHIQFTLVPHYRNIPNSELLADLRRVAETLGVKTFPTTLYSKHGRYKHLTYQRRFGGWIPALKKAGLQPSRNFRVTKESVLTDIQKIARQLKTKELYETHYLARGRYSTSLIYRHFGTWHHACKCAGLVSAIAPPPTREELFTNIKQVWQHLRHQPKSTDMHAPLSRFSLTPYNTKFGGWQNALAAFVQFQTEFHPATVPKLIQPIAAPIKITPHKTTRTINWRLRFLTLQKDRFRCRACGRSPATHRGTKLEVDHIKPWTRGGETVAKNLQTLCQTCNGGKGDLRW